MIPSLQPVWKRLEEQRAAVLARLDGLSDEQRNVQLNGKWSVNQIIAHLVASERLSLGYVKKKILGVNEVTDTGPWEELKMLVLVVSQRVPGMKYKAPKVVVKGTITTSDYQALKNEWQALRSEWREFADALPDTYAKRKLFKHPAAGRLNIEHCLRFMREHIHHHVPQLERYIKSR